MVPSNIRQTLTSAPRIAWDATIEYWQQVAGLGPVWTATVQPENQVYRGQPTTGKLETAMGYIGNVQIEVIRPLNDAPYRWTEWRTPDLQIPRAGHFQHFMIESDDFEATLENLLEGGALSDSRVTSLRGNPVRGRHR